jgi:hypothetical protein
MAVLVVQSTLLELHKTWTLDNVQSDVAFVHVTHRTLKFACGKSVRKGVGLPSKVPKVQAARLHLLFWQHFHTAQFHEFASSLVNIKLNVFCVK